jgi:hypothetical protein
MMTNLLPLDRRFVFRTGRGPSRARNTHFGTPWLSRAS